MILQITAICLVSAILLLHEANGASYSNVVVQNDGPEVVPVEYYNYGAPAVIASPQIARLSASPVGSVVPVQTISNVIPPCISPCIASAAPNAKFITYNSPNVPVVVAPSENNGYEYSYVVYDENTGDRKAQRELSDGAVVRGEYSFLQPDGYVREVQYRADDLTGFNVVVKRILPEAVGGDKKPEKIDPTPCPLKHEELKVKAVPEKQDNDQWNKDNHVEPTNNEYETEEPTHEAVQMIEMQPGQESIQEHEPIHVPEPEQDKPNHPEPEQAQEPEPEIKPKPEHEPEPAQITEVAQVEEVTPAVTHQAVVEIVNVPHEESAPKVVVSYEEVLRCLQAKSQIQNGLNFSPLTYIILPASNRPC